MKPNSVVTCLASAVVLMICGGCEDSYSSYEYIIKYDNIIFAGPREYNVMLIKSGPLPGNVDLLLADGKRIHVASITRDGMAEMFSEPKLFLDDPGEKREHFGDLCFTVAYLNGELDFIEVYDNVKVVKLPENAVVTFPATRQDIERVFGKPTSVEKKRYKRRGP